MQSKQSVVKILFGLNFQFQRLCGINVKSFFKPLNLLRIDFCKLNKAWVECSDFYVILSDTLSLSGRSLCLQHVWRKHRKCSLGTQVHQPQKEWEKNVVDDDKDFKNIHQPFIV